ncbi:serine hydrolase domain-containing protein [Chitinasiproducens palmae]|uniref:CubicO group peptidase, beta-lactamase class C family n=1 Tax=Chitinasiproducens palmae TaxID=1770053 RepID=A0A1H2PL99_9BURK|nr:serine hydrolase domain-containing protein [Chitinasiproducens palmae]SDV46757.1 CubicO group peptidase, beta-lactamase class C family [Chitinasiproducens palmae]
MSLHIDRRRFIGATGALAAGLVLPGTARAAGAPNPTNPPKAAGACTTSVTGNAGIDALAKCFIERWNMPGMSLSFGRGGQIFYEQAYGYTEFHGTIPVTTDTRFRIASVTKPFTSAAIFQLIEAGELTLETPVFTGEGVLNQFADVPAKTPRKVDAIQIQHLLRHLCGGWSSDGNDPMFLRQYWDLDHDALIRKTLATQGLAYMPGQCYAYSNFGYCLLGRVIEKITGQPYDTYVRNAVLAPIGVDDMVIATSGSQPPEAGYYDPDDSAFPYQFPITRMDSHGGWIARASDLVRFGAAVFAATDKMGGPALLKPSSIATITSVNALSTACNKAYTPYGCGWSIYTGGPNAFHFGSLSGTTSVLVHTHTGLVWSALLNSRPEDGTQEAMQNELDALMWAMAACRPDWQAGA